MKELNRKNRFSFFFLAVSCGIINNTILAQRIDSLSFRCSCKNKSQKEIEHSILYKSLLSNKYVINFNIEGSRNDTLLVKESKVYLKTVGNQRVLLDFSDLNFKNTVYPISGLGFNVSYLKKKKINKINYYYFRFESLVTDVPFISGLVVSEDLHLFSFTYFDSYTNYNCVLW